jgi:hypothetical protein
MPQPRKPSKAGSKTRVKQLDMPADVAGKATAKVADLTIADLNDLAERAAGTPVDNRDLDGLTADDIRSLEEVFEGAKLAAAGQFKGLGIAEGGEPLEGEIFDNWSCCCCTPCCCCAAAEVDPFAEPAGALTG